MSFIGRSLAVALVLAGSGCAPFPVGVSTTEPSASPTPAASEAPLGFGDLRGQVRVPVIAVGGGNVVAVGGGNVIAAGGGNVVAVGGSNVIAPGGGSVIAPAGGNVVAVGGLNYRVANAPVDELPVFGAVVVLRDPVTRQRLPWTRPVFTDERGQFHFEQVPTGMTYMVDVTFLTADRKAFRLLTVARSGQAEAQVDWRTTAVASAMAEVAHAQGSLYVADPAMMAPAIAELERVAAAMPSAEREARMRAAVATTVPAAGGEAAPIVDASALAALRDRLAKLGGKPGQAGTLAVPDVLGVETLVSSREVAHATAAKDTTFKQRLGELRAAVSAAPGAEQQGLIAQAGQMLTIKPALPAPSSAPGAKGGTGASGSSGGKSQTGSSSSGSTTDTGPVGDTADDVVDDTVDGVRDTVDDVTDTVGDLLTGGTNREPDEEEPAAGDQNGESDGGGLLDPVEEVVDETTDTVGGVVDGVLGGLLGGKK